MNGYNAPMGWIDRQGGGHRVITGSIWPIADLSEACGLASYCLRKYEHEMRCSVAPSTAPGQSGVQPRRCEICQVRTESSRVMRLLCCRWQKRS